MVDIKFDAASFPSLSGHDEVVWAPIFITPILGSPERLVAAVAVVGTQERYLSVASGLEKLRCLYGESSQLIMAATMTALVEFEADLINRGKEALVSSSQGMGILSVGDARRVATKDVKEVASSWLGTISSLHDSFALTIQKTSEIVRHRPRGDQLPSSVCELAGRKKSPILQYFSQSIRKGTSNRSSLANVALDFEGQRVVANFSTIRPSASNVRAEFDRMLRRLWELDVTQVRAGHRESDAVLYELIIQQPKLHEFSGKPDRIKNALEDLKGQADEKNLVLRQFEGAEQIVDHLERREAA